MDCYWLGGLGMLAVVAAAAADKLAGKNQRGWMSQLAAEVAECYWMLQKDREPRMGWELVHRRQGVERLCRLHRRIDCSV